MTPNGPADRNAAALCWTVQPLRQESAARTGLLIAAVVLLSIGFGYSFGGGEYALLSLIVLAASLSRYWLPTSYEVDAEGVHSKHLGLRQQRAWREFRRVEVRCDGIFLSPFARQSRLDSFRGLFVRCAENRDAVAAFARCHVGSAWLQG
jgi:hypothetical protein